MARKLVHSASARQQRFGAQSKHTTWVIRNEAGTPCINHPIFLFLGLPSESFFTAPLFRRICSLPSGCRTLGHCAGARSSRSSPLHAITDADHHMISRAQFSPVTINFLVHSVLLKTPFTVSFLSSELVLQSLCNAHGRAAITSCKMVTKTPPV